MKFRSFRTTFGKNNMCGNVVFMADLIEVKNLVKIYRLGNERVIALSGLNFNIKSGEICCIYGTSGSGKSTLLNMLAGLEKPTSGEIIVDGVHIEKLNERRITRFRQKNVGFVFQSYNLMQGLSALENVALPLIYRGVPKKKRDKMAHMMLKMVGLESRWKHKPNQMSGGQQQRVGIARAFVAKPKIVFADEPTGNLDTKTTVEVMELMVNTCHANGLTLILVSHDSEIASFADRIITIIDGKIVSDEYKKKDFERNS